MVYGDWNMTGSSQLTSPHVFQRGQRSTARIHILIMKPCRNIAATPNIITDTLAIFQATLRKRSLYQLIVFFRENHRTIPYVMGKSMVSGFDFPVFVKPLILRLSEKCRDVNQIPRDPWPLAEKVPAKLSSMYSSH